MKPTTGAEVRRLARANEWTAPTPGLAPGYVQANLVCVPRELAFDFLLFCRRNPRPCPLLDVTDPGEVEPRAVAPGADVTTDCPLYRAYRHGELVEECRDLKSWWRPDLVAFLLGCSFTFENALTLAGVPLRHVEQGRNVPMYVTSTPCVPAGAFRGPMVVSMRPLTPDLAERAAAVCARYPLAHGAPVHVGDPAAIGVKDLARPDYGDAVDVRAGEVPVFWACGVTPQAVASRARPSLLLTHAPGHMFVTDWRDADLEGRGT